MELDIDQLMCIIGNKEVANILLTRENTRLQKIIDELEAKIAAQPPEGTR